jgi:hypothetical protein
MSTMGTHYEYLEREMLVQTVVQRVIFMFASKWKVLPRKQEHPTSLGGLPPRNAMSETVFL